jgi:exo-beta-1,3-glucanase (GH17 family)
MPLGRTFSFEDNDEVALSHNEQERLSYQSRNDASFRYYHDSPSRDVISPPPQYSSPPPDEPPSPIMSPTPAARRQQPSMPPDSTFHKDRSFDIPRVPLPPSRHSEEELHPPPPPPHRRRPLAETFEDGRHWGPPVGYVQSSPPRPMNTIPSDNLSTRAGSMSPNRVAEDTLNRYSRDRFNRPPVPSGAGADYNLGQRDPPPPSAEAFTPQRMNNSYPQLRPRDSYSSGLPLAAGAATPGSMTPGDVSDLTSSHISGRSIPLEDYPAAYPVPAGLAAYHDSPYQTSAVFHSQMSDANINPNNIADDGDDGFMPDPRRRSMLNMGRQPSTKVHGPAAAGAATAGGVKGILGGLTGRKQKTQTPSGTYNPVEPTRGTGNGLGPLSRVEKSEWLSRQTEGNNKMRWVVGFAIGTVIVLAVIGGIIGGVLGAKSSSSSDSGNNSNTAAGDTAANGDLDSSSPEIQALMNNPNLHKVFPGMDYTPWGTQYPLCLTYPPSQNNVTRDMAVLSQLTNAVRLYGTDCNQTEMTLHAIDRLGLKDMKVWLGVWIDTNQTTTDRQLAQMYKIIDETADHSIFKGAIIGNEALYRAGVDKASSEASLIQILTDVKANFTAQGWNIPVATSDLGDNWNEQLVAVVDIVMANIHPFFAGVTAEIAAGWTWDFWQQHDLVLTQGTNKDQVISETGWPSGGGTDCGGATGDCAPGQSGSIAGIAEMNTFMDTFICQAIANGTDFFW